MDDQQLHHLLELKNCKYPSSAEIEEFIAEFHRRHHPHSTSVWLLENLREKWSLLSFYFPGSKLAYATVALLVLCSSFFFFYHRFDGENSTSEEVPLCSEHFAALHYYSLPIIGPGEEEPVVFNSTEGQEEEVLSSISHFIKRKPSLQGTLISF